MRNGTGGGGGAQYKIISLLREGGCLSYYAKEGVMANFQPQTHQ